MRMIRRRWIGLGLLALIGLLLAWVLLSTAALRLVLRQVPGLSSEAEAGRLVGPIELGVLRWSDGAMRVEADGVHLAHRFMPLFGGELVVQTLVVERLRIVLPPAVDPPPPATPPSEWRLDLPALDLPGDLQLDGLEVQQVEVLSADEAVLLQGQLSAQDLSIVGGRIRVGQLQAQAESIGSVQLSADLDSGDRWSGELKAQAELTSGDIRTVELSLNGGLDHYELQLDAQGALQVQGRIELSALTQAPGWQLRLEGQRAATAEAEDLRFDLSGEGERGIGTISGELQQGEQQLQLQSVQIRLDDDQMLRVPAAQLSASGPLSLTASAKGQWPLDESAPAGELRLSWQDLVLADAESPLRSDQGELQLSGRPEAYTLSLRAAIARAGQAPTPDAIGDLQLQAQGDLQQLQSLVATLESNFGRIEIDGQVQFEPLQADLALQTSGLDTGVLLPELPGELGLQGRAKLARAEEQLSAELEIEQLSGQLRDAPMQGEGHLAWVDAELPSGRLRLSWGDNEIGYQRPTGESGQLLLQIDQPGLLLADLQGSVRGQLMLPALLDQWRQASGELKVRSLSLDQLSVEQISLQRAAGTDQPLSLQLEGLQAAGQRLDTASAQLQPGERWTLQLDASGPDMNLTLGASAGVEEGTWSGQLRDLQFAHGDYPAVALDSATGWRWSENGGGGLEDSCLSVREGRICLQLSHAPDSGLSLEGRFEALQLAWLEPLWIDTPARLQGALSGEVKGRWDLDRRLVVDGELQIPQLQLSLPSADGGERIERTAALQLRLGDGQAQADAEPTGQHAELQLDLADQGALQVVVDGDALAADPTWTLAIRSDGVGLQILEGVSPELVSPQGTLVADLQLLQRQSQWAAEGQLRLQQAAMELPAAGLQLSAVDLSVNATPGGVFELTGSGQSGEGQFQLSGSYPLDPEADASLTIKGERVQVVNLPIVRMTASPDLQVERRGGEIRAKGTVLIPTALIDLARFEPSVKPSTDVVVVDDPPQESGLPMAIRADIQVQMGDAVRLKGFGLDGRLSGSLGVRERPGRPTTGRGELNVTGEFKAYGQDLTIKRGKLLFSGGPLANPGLDLLAIREVDAIEAGVRVRGAAERPELSVYSDPPMDQAEAFSYLVLGRPLNAASGDDTQQLGAAAAALGSVGGSLIASKLGNNGSGLSVGVESSADLGGAALTVGRYITPDIYFGVGQSLFEQIQVAILRYRLSSRFELEALSGRELKAGVNYRYEK